MKKKLITVDIVLVILSVICVGLTIALGVANPVMLLIAAAVLAVLFVVLLLNIKRLRRLIAKLLHGQGYDDSLTQHSLANLRLPVLVLSGKSIVWYNEAFANGVLPGQEHYLQSVYKTIPGFDPEKVSRTGGQALEIGDHSFTVFGGGTVKGDGLFVAYFVDDTVLKTEAAEYHASRPAVLHITVDTYEDVLKDLKDSERAALTGEIDRVFEKFIDGTSGFLLRLSSSRYLAVMEERHIAKIIEGRFAILDRMREISNDNGVVTLSIGVGRGGTSFSECEKMARTALDMALGRGGDQAAVRTPDGSFEFYGGVSRSVEKRTKVKSRIIASALSDIIRQSDSVLIMGHKMSDLDAIGAAIGVLRFCMIMEKPAAIVVDEKHTFAGSLITRMRENGRGDDFISPAEALEELTAKTLVIIVDTHVPHLLESADLYRKAKNVVVIDHHRKMVGHIDNAVIFYHEPYASSTCELVSELLQYVGERENRPTALESEAMLAGIMLDTRDFVINAGVRTFEAAAYLRRMGAQTQNVKRLFSGSLENYVSRARLVSEAVLYKGCAIVVSDKIPSDSSVIVPQAANDLLSIDGVQASFVAMDMGGYVSISARSYGELNVQVIMEKLGGGGHLTMAGAQMKDVSLEKTKVYLMAAIDEYRKNQEENEDAAHARRREND
ncbi:MAG TPA: DHH family phosphoesterase [Candidatus Pygmaiobacter gallistercoris]|nr:DHH family phosphoesterase [Candidatus Pygmaiobacter gallistercoris]